MVINYYVTSSPVNSMKSGKLTVSSWASPGVVLLGFDKKDPTHFGYSASRLSRDRLGFEDKERTGI